MNKVVNEIGLIGLNIFYYSLVAGLICMLLEITYQAFFIYELSIGVALIGVWSSMSICIVLYFVCMQGRIKND